MSVAETPSLRETKFDLRLWRRFLAIAKPYWFHKQTWKARLLVVLLLGLLLAYTGFNVWFNYETGEFTSALAAHDGGRFWRSIFKCVVLLMFSVPLYASYYYIRDKLAVDWRQWLTHRFIDSYFNNRAFYNLTSNEDVDNPDQRITDDINHFTQKSLYFLLIIFEQVLQLVAFSGVLWAISSELVFFLILYAAVGTVVTAVFFGKALIGLNYYQLQREGDFRYRLVRVRENAESIALYRGESQEAEQIKESFHEGYLNFNKLIRMQLRLNLFQHGYSSLTALLPAVILANQVLRGEMEIGRLVQAIGAFVAILKAVSLIIDKFDALTQFAAGIDRLNAFAGALLVQAGGKKESDREFPASETRKLCFRM
jgi:putative ATP-binding cassette transporter